MFGKDSLGSSDFEIRPLDIDGNMINNIEISVEAKISVDGDEYDLKKVQKQNWVKKRGTDTRELQGNVNEFDINGYPKSQKEFKEFISGIVKEDVFNLITNPSAFNTWIHSRWLYRCRNSAEKRMGYEVSGNGSQDSRRYP